MPISRKFLAALLCLAFAQLSLLSALSVAQTVVWSDDFESYEPQSFTNSDTFGRWMEDDGTRPTVIDGLSARNGQNSLRLDEGPGGDTNGDGELTDDDNNGFGSFVYVGFPEVYSSGAYSLSFSQFVEGSVDSLHRVIVSQQVFPDGNTGVDIFFDGQGLFLQFPDGSPAPIAVPWQIDEAGDFFPVWDEDDTGGFVVNPLLVTDRWVEQEINVDLDNNTFEWVYDGQTMITYGTRQWDADPTDEFGPTLAGASFFIGDSNSDANSDGVFGSVFYDDFVLTEVVPPSPPSDIACDIDGDGDCDAADLNELYANQPADLAAEINDWLDDASARSEQTFVLGDANLDGTVNSADLGLLLNNFGGSAAGWDGGDLNGDDTVNSADLGLLLNNFGATSASASAVPEPACAPLLFVAFGFAIAMRRKTRSES